MGGGLPTEWFPNGRVPNVRERSGIGRMVNISKLTKVAIVILAVFAMAVGEAIWVFLGLFTFALILAPILLKNRYDVAIPVCMEFLIFFALFMHIIGAALNLYEAIPHWDVITHLLTSFTIAILVLTVIYMSHTCHDSSIASARRVMALTILVTLVIGLIWEFIELSSDTFLGTQTVHGITDTVGDLVMDGVGIFLAIAIGTIWMRSGRMERMTVDFGGTKDMVCSLMISPR